MVDNAGTNHIQIDVNQTLQQMLSGFDGSGMVSIFPESPFAFFPLVVFLCCSSCDQSNRLGNNTIFTVILYDYMDVI